MHVLLYRSRFFSVFDEVDALPLGSWGIPDCVWSRGRGTLGYSGQWTRWWWVSPDPGTPPQSPRLCPQIYPSSAAAESSGPNLEKNEYKQLFFRITDPKIYMKKKMFFLHLFMCITYNFLFKKKHLYKKQKNDK